MKALTVCQPYAHLIATGEKRVENRRWATPHRGLLAIHAGKSLEWMGHSTPEDYPGMAFGAIVAVAELAGCVRLSLTDATSGTAPDWAAARWPWLAEHVHTEGPVCWVLENVRRLQWPVPCTGARALWDVPADVLHCVESQLKEVRRAK